MAHTGRTGKTGNAPPRQIPGIVLVPDIGARRHAATRPRRENIPTPRQILWLRCLSSPIARIDRISIWRCNGITRRNIRAGPRRVGLTIKVAPTPWPIPGCCYPRGLSGVGMPGCAQQHEGKQCPGDDSSPLHLLHLSKSTISKSLAFRRLTKRASCRNQ